jgi:hypothetical protein
MNSKLAACLFLTELLVFKQGVITWQVRLILIGTTFYKTHLAVTPNKAIGDTQSSVNVLSGKDKQTLFHNLMCATAV